MTELKPLSELFAEARAPAIEYGGHCVVQSFSLKIERHHKFSARVIHAREDLRQAITIAVRPGAVSHIGERHRSVICWYDREPWTMEADLVPSKAGGQMHVWNSWLRNGTTHAWTGNAGMIIEQPDASKYIWIAHCSAGVGKPDFADFVFTFEIWEPPATPVG